MSSNSRDSLSLQWQLAVNTFIGILLAGVITIAVSGYVTYTLFDRLQIPQIGLLVYHVIALVVLLVLAVLFSFKSYLDLSRPLNNLERITHALPLLSSKRYDAAKEIFQNVEDLSKHQEINQLRYATLQLTNLLEEFDVNELQRSRLIRAKNDELKLSRDFINNLLDTAQLIILTINKDYEISLLNDYGENLTGYNKSEIINTTVSKMFPAGNWTEVQSLFNDLVTHHINLVQQDSELIDKDGSIRQVSWLHSRIDGNDPSAVVLSVGLDRTEERAEKKQIVWLAEHDPLTGLCNRRKFTEEFEKSLQTAIRYQHNNTLLFLDLDSFKDINDASGDRAGDELLQSVARTLEKVTRFTDLVARLGSDEFAILLPETDAEGAKIIAHKIIQQLAQIKSSDGEVKHKVSVSIGIVHFPFYDASIPELLGFADLALHKAKSNGKGSFHTFSADDQTQQQLEMRVFWEQKIEDALENDHFVLHYQPILNIESSTIQHYEVLLRMRDIDTGELQMPSEFIQIAEKVGLIHRIDHYVLRHSIMKLATLQQQGIPAKLAINLSGAVIDDPELLSLIKHLISKHHVKPEGLIFELTETAAVSNLKQAKALMIEIRKLGCQFSLDDFGVGFASFNYMRELPVNIIKIDGIFIQHLDKNADDRLFVKALVDVAKGLGKKTIAEFVENKEILELLDEFGLDYAQGYYIGRPDIDIRDSIDWQPSDDFS